MVIEGGCVRGHCLEHGEHAGEKCPICEPQPPIDWFQMCDFVYCETCREHHLRGKCRVPSGPPSLTLRGCVCPPGSEATCQGPTCPRKPWRIT